MDSRRLGRGLDDLIKKTAPAGGGDDTARGAPHDVPVEAVDPNPYQPRREFDIDSLNELIDSIRIHGVLQPVTVRALPSGRYELIAGERRWRAARELGLERIPAVIHALDDQRMLEVALIENIQREDLTPIEKAKAYRRLMAEFALTQEQTAQRLSQKRSTVANYVRLLELPEEVQALVASGRVTMGHARALAGVAGAERQAVLAQRVADGALSVRELEERVRALKKPPRPSEEAPRSGTPSTPADVQLREIERRLREALATKVSLRARGGGGRLTIEYYDAAALQRILACIEAGSAARDRVSAEAGS